MREECGCGTGTVLLSFLLGGIVGAGCALLMAPQSGREARHRIREFTEDVKGKAREYAEDMKGKVSSGVDKSKELYDEKKSMLTTAFEAGKEAYEKEKERLSEEPNA